MSVRPFHLEHSCWTAEYLLDHCERFRVESTEGTLGYVEQVMRSRDDSGPSALLVRTNGADEALVLVPIGDVLELHPNGESIIVRAPTAEWRHGTAAIAAKRS